MHTKVKSFILIAALFALLSSLWAQTPHKGQFSTGTAALQGKWYLQAVLASDTAAGNESAFLKNLVRSNGYKIQNGIRMLTVDGTELSRWSREIIKPKKSFKT